MKKKAEEQGFYWIYSGLATDQIGDVGIDLLMKKKLQEMVLSFPQISQINHIKFMNE
jgi:hypothetical protein